MNIKWHDAEWDRSLSQSDGCHWVLSLEWEDPDNVDPENAFYTSLFGPHWRTRMSAATAALRPGGIHIVGEAQSYNQWEVISQDELDELERHLK